MNEQRRKLLAAKTAAERARLAAGITTDEANKPMPSTIVYSKHFMIEPQTAEDGVEEYAVYRLTDMLSTVTADGATIEPVHVFETTVDAATWVVIADAIMEKEDPDSTPVPEGLRVRMGGGGQSSMGETGGEDGKEVTQ